MLENNRMETLGTEVASIWRRKEIENSMKSHRYFIDLESRIHIKISRSNRYHNFHVDSPFKIDVAFTNFARGISTLNRWRNDKDGSIGWSLLVDVFITSWRGLEDTWSRRIYSSWPVGLLQSSSEDVWLKRIYSSW